MQPFETTDLRWISTMDLADIVNFVVDGTRIKYFPAGQQCRAGNIDKQNEATVHSAAVEYFCPG